MENSLASLKEKQEIEKNNLSKKHENELNFLLNSNDKYSLKGLEQKKIKLLNQQQIEMSKLESKLAIGISQLQTSTKAELDSKHAKEKLDLREKHYQVS